MSLEYTSEIDRHSPDYTLQWLVDVWYLTENDIKELTVLYKKEEIIKWVIKILLDD